MSNVKTYWIAIPGSSDPPTGPFDLDEIAARVKAGTVGEGSTVCLVGGSEWLPTTRLFPSHEVSVAAVPNISVLTPRAVIEKHYANLTSVGASTSTWGLLFKILGFMSGTGALMVLYFGATGRDSTSLIVGGSFLVGIGFALFAAGTLIAAIGEALLALKDIAVNSRIVADRAENKDG